MGHYGVTLDEGEADAAEAVSLFHLPRSKAAGIF
jgi:hypothetical protein